MYRKPNSTRYFTDKIAAAIKASYAQRIRSRYTLNANLFDGLCVSIASMISGYLQKMTEAEAKGWLREYEEASRYRVKAGKHAGQILGTLGRRTIFGYAFLTPKREQCEEALHHLEVLLNPDADDGVRSEAEQYTMSFGPRRGKQLGSLRRETLLRLKALTERDLERADEMVELRAMAQHYLRFTPPRWPTIKSDGLSAGRRRQLHAQHLDALDACGALPTISDAELAQGSLTEDERRHYRELQQRVYADTNQPTYLPLRWMRADAVIRHRECGLVYDPKKRRYLFLGNLLANGSRHCRILNVKGDLFDVNNPDVPLQPGKRKSIAMLFELEFDKHQQQVLDQARRHSFRWKDANNRSGGSVRSATLHACYNQDRKQWWFEVHLAIGIKPTHIEVPQNVAGVHVDPMNGWFITILSPDGTHHAHFHLDEYTVAAWLGNKDPVQQAELQPNQRTAKERHHRIADALVAICKHYHAQVGIENIGYRKRSLGPQPAHVRDDYSRSVVTLLDYKLACEDLPLAIDIRGVAPKRDCGRCGCRHAHAQVNGDVFTCATCGHSESQYVNTSREIARHILWSLAQRTKPKQQQQHAMAV